MSNNIELMPEKPTFEEMVKYAKTGFRLLKDNPLSTLIMLAQCMAICAVATIPFFVLKNEIAMSGGSESLVMMISSALTSTLQIYILCSGPLWMIILMNHFRTMDLGLRPPAISDDIRCIKKVYRRIFTTEIVLLALVFLLIHAVMNYFVFGMISDDELVKRVLKGDSVNTSSIFLLASMVSSSYDVWITGFLLPTLPFFIFYVMKFDFGGEGFFRSAVNNINNSGTGRLYSWFVAVVLFFMVVDMLVDLAFVIHPAFGVLFSMAGPLVYMAFFYPFCIDKIEGRKLEAKEKVSIFDGEAEAV